MYIPFIAPSISQVIPSRNERGIACSWVKFSAADVLTGNIIERDLYVERSSDLVQASIDRATLNGPLLILAELTTQKTPSGQPWWRGDIGPASELDLPDFDHMIDPTERDQQSVIFAPTVTGMAPASDVCEFYFEGMTATCVDIVAGEKHESRHIAVPMQLDEIAAFIEHAIIVRCPLVVWYGPAWGAIHSRTGLVIHVGRIERLSYADMV